MGPEVGLLHCLFHRRCYRRYTTLCSLPSKVWGGSDARTRGGCAMGDARDQEDPPGEPVQAGATKADEGG